MKDEFIKKLRGKYEKGEISKETYEDILKRYTEEVRNEVEEERTSDEKKTIDFSNIADVVNHSVSQAMKEVERELDNIFPETEEKKERGYKCAGSCVLGPGRYDYISAAGSLKITGDIVTDRISVSGSLISEGNIKAELFKTAGSAKVEGNIDAETVSVAGAFKGRNVTGEDIHLSGGIKCVMIKGENVDIAGAITAEVVDGEEIRIKLKNGSKVNKISGEDIRVECKKGFLHKLVGKLEVKEIVGETVYLECISANYVKGENVIVGENCVIETLEAESMKISKGAKVKKVVRK